VKTHVMHILQRLRARTRAHAVGIGHKHGLLA
jgi:DNA-binding CsgD family transcriptional regulator